MYRPGRCWGLEPRKTESKSLPSGIGSSTLFQSPCTVTAVALPSTMSSGSARPFSLRTSASLGDIPPAQ